MFGETQDDFAKPTKIGQFDLQFQPSGVKVIKFKMVNYSKNIGTL